MTDDPNLTTYCLQMLWNDDPENGTYFAVVLAPDDETAERMVAAEMLSHGQDNLFELYGHEEEPGTLTRYFESHSELSAWGDLSGIACPNCTSHAGRPNGDHIELDGKTAQKHVCSSCGYAWLPLGFDEPTRTQLEDAASIFISKLDDIERESAQQDDGE